MTRLPAILALGFCLLALPRALWAQQEEYEIKPLGETGYVECNFDTHSFLSTNPVVVRYAGAVLTADQASGNYETGDIRADGHVHIQRDEQVWVSEHIHCNFKTGPIEALQFRTGHPPVFAEGQGLDRKSVV